MKKTASRKTATGYFDKDRWEDKIKCAAENSPWLADAMVALAHNLETLTSDFEDSEVVSNFIYPH